jgi:hypothetical protein
LDGRNRSNLCLLDVEEARQGVRHELLSKAHGSQGRRLLDVVR